jgi:hypothetical protein
MIVIISKKKVFSLGGAGKKWSHHFPFDLTINPLMKLAFSFCKRVFTNNQDVLRESSYVIPVLYFIIGSIEKDK